MMVATPPNNTRRKSKTKSKHKTNFKPQNNKTPPASASVPKQIKIYTIQQLSEMTIAQAIQESTSTAQLLHTANRMWLPTDDDLAPHLRTQKIHHDKRIKAASQLLMKLGDCMGMDKGMDKGMDVGVGFQPEIWMEAGENGLVRAILAASLRLPFKDANDANKNEKVNVDGRNVCIALAGIHSIVGYTLPHASSNKIAHALNNHDIVHAIQRLISDADGLAWKLPMYEAVQVRWAIRGILSRWGPLLYGLGPGGEREHEHEHEHANNMEHNGDVANGIVIAKNVIPNLNERVAKLPFDIIPSCIDWDSFDVDTQENNDRPNAMKSLLNDIPFNLDTITTRTGSRVEERRGTAWVAEDGIGALAYSGKLMNPHPLPDIVARAMRQVEEGIIQMGSEKNQELELCHDTIGKYFDCALCNHYPNEESACKFHTDPEHGIYWERLTCVVSAGNDDVRKFAFRPIPNENEWDRYETRNSNSKSKIQRDDAILPAVIPLFPGDVVVMDHDCNDLFHHAVYGKQLSSTDATSVLGGSDSDGRVSLVFKRAMDRGNGRKGHGKAGQGRRGKKY